jgi:hypothetical protein
VSILCAWWQARDAHQILDNRIRPSSGLGQAAFISIHALSPWRTGRGENGGLSDPVRHRAWCGPDACFRASDLVRDRYIQHQHKNAGAGNCPGCGPRRRIRTISLGSCLQVTGQSCIGRDQEKRRRCPSRVRAQEAKFDDCARLVRPFTRAFRATFRSRRTGQSSAAWFHSCLFRGVHHFILELSPHYEKHRKYERGRSLSSGNHQSVRNRAAGRHDSFAGWLHAFRLGQAPEQPIQVTLHGERRTD